jgi:cellulose synthase/poly-beta-1,6-N-acetylglucosamine synthase-like glycosyltransferase
VPAEASCRDQGKGYAWAVGLGALLLALGAIALPKLVFYVLLTWTLVTLALQTALKAVAWALQLCVERRPPRTVATRPLVRLPTVSLMIPLYKEREIAQRLVQRLQRLDYPQDLLDICLVVESDDLVTQDALEATTLPTNMRKIVVPDAQLKTKPRALNYALEFCRGSIVGVYYAEDAPEPDQILKVAQRFHAAPQDVACLQGVLDFYNPHHNWMARCFTIEYATWFRVNLPGLLRLGMVIPLGGTTIFFRRSVLEQIGGWDAHNVTEDADLGIRLARHGYRTELIDTVTFEEANCRLWPWIKQRSRWLKGYAVTWAVHSQRPRTALHALGLWRFFGVQLLLLGTLTQFVVAPVLWSFWLLTLGFGHMVHADFGTQVIWWIAGLFIVSEALSIATRLHGVGRTQHKRLRRWVPSLYLYFPLATVAVYKSLVELVTKPFYWDKTSHGSFSATETDPGPAQLEVSDAALEGLASPQDADPQTVQGSGPSPAPPRPRQA